MLDAGRYRAIAVEWGLGYTDGGKPQVAVLFDLLDFPGHQITWYGYFTEKTQERTLESLRHCGWTCDRLDVLEGMGSQEVSVVVEHETDQGQTKAKVRWVNRPAGIAMKAPMDAGALAAFAQQMRGAALATMPKKPAASRPAPARSAAPVQHGVPMPDDSDIPPPF